MAGFELPAEAQALRNILTRSFSRIPATYVSAKIMRFATLMSLGRRLSPASGIYPIRSLIAALPLRCSADCLTNPSSGFAGIHRAGGNKLRERASRWASGTSVLRQSRPELPDQLNDRAQDGWEPLLSRSGRLRRPVHARVRPQSCYRDPALEPKTSRYARWPTAGYLQCASGC